MGPTLGPVIGGVLSQSFNWRCVSRYFVFWSGNQFTVTRIELSFGSCASALPYAVSRSSCKFHFIHSNVSFLRLAYSLRFLPETLRAIVGDGSVPAGWIYTAPMPIVGRRGVTKKSGELPPRKPLTNPFTLFTYPDVFILLLFNGTFYAVFYGVTASLSTSFEEIYPYLTQTDIGLCFLAIGGGMFIGTTLTGKIMDAHYRKIRNNLVPQAQTEPKKAIDPGSLPDSFPIERARLQIMPYLIVVYTSCVIGYGWSLQAKTSIAVPLILQIISTFYTMLYRLARPLTLRHVVGATVVSVMNAITALLVDLVPQQGSSITACVCLCLLGLMEVLSFLS